MIKEAITLPPEIIDGLIAVGSAILGWIARMISKKKQVEAIKTENEKLKTIVKEYDGAARDALRTARRPKPPAE